MLKNIANLLKLILKLQAWNSNGCFWGKIPAGQFLIFYLPGMNSSTVQTKSL
jgi:hypothetical protein